MSTLPKAPADGDQQVLEAMDAYESIDELVQNALADKAGSFNISAINVIRGALLQKATRTVGAPLRRATLPEWLALRQSFVGSVGTPIQSLLSDSERQTLMAVKLPLSEKTATGDNFLYLDASKSHVTRDFHCKFIALLEAIKFPEARDGMFAGKPINATEGRSVLHVALREQSPSAKILDKDGTDVMPLVREVKAKMQGFSEKVRSGEWKGFSGKPVSHIVNIGIGGSDLGPVMATEALKPYGKAGLQVHFVSNVDGAQIADVLDKVDLETTLFIVASKTFTTIETITNATTARDRLLKHYEGKTEATAKHFVAVSTNTAKVEEFGIDKENMFGFWDWVGGRYSMWSAIGLSIALYIGYDNWNEMLAGAAELDQHFKTAPLAENLPVLLAMVGVYYNNFAGSETQAVLPYAQYLHRFPAYLQQLDMESNGKMASTENGLAVDVQTGPVVFGEPGTNGQHAFYQLLHQGTKIIPADFIGTLETHRPVSEFKHHKLLVANMLAQSEALMKGKPSQTARLELADEKGLNQVTKERLVPHKTFLGDRPSNTIFLRHLTPRAFGALVATYEHKVFTMGVVWGINSFDQFGVELGKKLATSIEGQMHPGQKGTGHDASTNSLLTLFNEALGAREEKSE